MRTCILSVKTEKKKNKRSQGGKESTDLKNNSNKGTHSRVHGVNNVTSKNKISITCMKYDEII